MNRRHFLKTLGITGASAMIPMTLAGCTSTAQRVNQLLGDKENPPNIILMITDDQGFGQFDFLPESYNKAVLAERYVSERYAVDLDAAIHASRSAMPTLKKLAVDGVRFSNAHVTHPVCAASRTGVMTSRYPHQFGIYNNDDVRPGVPLEETFLPEVFQQNGYRTGAIGKWHLAKVRKEAVKNSTSRDYHDNSIIWAEEGYRPTDRGFDYFFGYHASGVSSYNSPTWMRNGELAESRGYMTDQLTDEALAFVRSVKKEQPFFLYFAHAAPHIPLTAMAPEKYLSRFNTGNRDVDNYYASIAAIDDSILQLMNELEASGRADNTIFLFMPDNGGVADSPMPQNGLLRGNKGTLMDGGVHIPLVAWGKSLPKGMIYDGLVSTMDLMPTLLAASGLNAPQPEKLDGVNLLPHLDGTDSGEPHDLLFWAGPRTFHWGEPNDDFWRDYFEYVSGSTGSDVEPSSAHLEKYSTASWSVRKGQWSLHWWQNDNTVRLYNRAVDPAELNDIATGHPALVEEMKAGIRAWIKDKPEPAVWGKDYFKTLKNSLLAG